MSTQGSVDQTDGGSSTGHAAGEHGQNDPEYVDAVFGGLEPDGSNQNRGPRTTFAPWHHPVKQIVRDYQWADQVRRLLRDHRTEDGRGTLRYFTLPGADLFDVRVLADALSASKTRIEYFGFDVGYDGAGVNESREDVKSIYLETESALRQSGQITDRAEILADRLEDIAQDGSHASNRLRQREVFDVVNIDACDHLGFVPKGRSKSIFDALETLLAHQLRAANPWLLFITTRAKPDLLGLPATKLQSAIFKNLEQHSEAFGQALASCIGGKVQTIAADLNGHWSTQSRSFLKLFCIGLGKYLLQYYHAQQNLPATVELVSAFNYKVSSDEPDMLSLAFRINPNGIKVQPGSAGGAAVIPALELKYAVGVVEKADKLWDLDEAVAANDVVKQDAVAGTERLLALADYDIQRWKVWLASLPVRPMQLDDAA